MNREEYMKRLERALDGVSQSEKAEALQYYNDYFDDAGVENEQDVMNNLGTPENLAETIKREQAGQQDSFEQNTVFEDAYVETTGSSENEEKEKKTKTKLSGGWIALIVVLTILALPLILPIIATVLAAIVSVFAGIFSVIVTILAVVLTLICVVIACMIAAVAVGAFSPFGAVVIAGVGIIFIGVCIFSIMAVVWLFGVALPWLVKGIIQLFKKLFEKISGKKGEKQ